MIGITAESVAKVAATKQSQQLHYKFMADTGARTSTAFGVAYRIPEETAKAYHENGIEFSKAPDGNGSWLVVPTAFIIDRNGGIRFVYSNADPSIRISSDDLVAAATAIIKK